MSDYKLNWNDRRDLTEGLSDIENYFSLEFPDPVDHKAYAARIHVAIDAINNLANQVDRQELVTQSFKIVLKAVLS